MGNLHHAPHHLRKHTNGQLSHLRAYAKYAKANLLHAADNVKDRMSSSLHKSSKKISRTSASLKNNAVGYAKQHPIKIIAMGVTAVASVVAAILFRNKH